MSENMEVDEERPTRHLLAVESIKMMGESVGITTLNDDAAAWLSEDLEYRLEEIVQNSIKFMRHSKRRGLLCSDLDNALKAKNIEPLYGFEPAEYIPFRHTSGGGKELYYTAEKEIDLVSLLNSPLPRLPCDVSLRTHWLCVDGVQPSIPENPPLCTIEDQREEALAMSVPHMKSSEPVAHVKDIKFSKKERNKEVSVSNEWSKLKPLQAHSLSLEQQLYYKEITEACIGLSSDLKCQEALGSLATDPGLYQLVPQFISFINEGVKVNIAKRKLSVLKQLLKMVSALLENSSLSLEKYLHELLPSVLTCLVNKQVCPRPEAEDHWSLRDLAAKILSRICKKYSNSVNNIQTRLTRTLAQALRNNTQGLAVHYGAIMGLVELGPEAVTSLVIPRLKLEGELIRSTPGSSGSVAEQVAAGRLQSMIQRHCAPVLLSSRPSTDTLQDYQNNYGHLGQVLFNQVKTLRQNRVGLQNLASPTAMITSTALKFPITQVSKANRPPSLNITSPHLIAVKVTGSGSGITHSPVVKSISSPTIAAALRLVTQSAQLSGSSTARPTTPVTSVPSISATLLSAVMANPNAQAVLSALASGASKTKASSTSTPAPNEKTASAESSPKTPAPTTTTNS